MYAVFARILIVVVICISVQLVAQQTVGLFHYDPLRSYNGLTLFCPTNSNTTYLIDNCGRVVHQWVASYNTGHVVRLLDDGSILRAANINNSKMNGGGAGGLIQRIGWEGSILWSYEISNDTLVQHHDVYPMKNGNVLALVWERKTKQQAIDAGRHYEQGSMVNQLWNEKIVEIKPTGAKTGDVVWEWNLWDRAIQEFDNSKANYGVLRTHPERFDINYGGGPIPDWVHANGIDYNEDLDQIIISAHTPGEIWIIDHSTTTAEASSHNGGNSDRGGDFLFRWGNNSIFGYGGVENKVFKGQHSAHWIRPGLKDAGKIMVFNNLYFTPNGASVDIINPLVKSNGDYERNGNNVFIPEAVDWRYAGTPPSSFAARFLSNAERLPNGNILACLGASGEFVEITSDSSIVWRYVNPVVQGRILSQGDTVTNNTVFRCYRYPYSHPAFVGKTLVHKMPLEQNPFPQVCMLASSVPDEQKMTLEMVTLSTRDCGRLLTARSTEDFISDIRVSDLHGRCYVERQSLVSLRAHEFEVEISMLPPGFYVVQLSLVSGRIVTRTWIKLE